MRSLRTLISAVAAMASAGCDESFAPIQPSDLTYSVFGHLDASADTQWIRVMPLRDKLLTSPGPLGASVTLEHLGSGRIIELRDSVFRFQQGPEVGSDGVYLHNFWTTEKIEAGAEYRFLASTDGSDPAEAVVKIPSDYEVEVWLDQPRSPRGDFLRVIGLKHVAIAPIVHFRDSCGFSVETDLLVSRSSDDEIPMIPIDPRPIFRSGCGSVRIQKREILVIGSGSAWPAGLQYSASALGVSDVPSNISNSIGFLGGVLTKVIPYENCEILSFFEPVTEHCRLRYSAASASLNGTIRSTCGGGGLADAIVRLREIDPAPPAWPKERSNTSGLAGEYGIGALEAGRRYALLVSGPTPEGREEYQEHTDTLEFAAGQNATYDVALPRLTPC